MVVARKIAYNVLVSSVAKVLSTVLALVAIGFITRYLGSAGFGNYSTVLAFLSFFAAITDLGIQSISTREISRAGADEEKIIGNILALRLIVSVLIFIFSPLVIWFFPYSGEVKLGVVVVAASYIFSSSYQVLNGVFQKNLAMDRVAVAELLGKFIQVGTIILAVRYDLGFTWIVSSLLFYMIFTSSLVFILIRKYIHLRPRIDLSYWKSFLKESYSLGISAVIIFVYFKIDTILLSVMKNSSDVGIYNAAYKVIENISFFPAMIVGLVFPIVSHNVFINRERFIDIANKTFKTFFLLVVPLIVGGSFLAEDIIALIGGAGFQESAGVLNILVFALACIFFSNFLNSILIAANQQRKLVLALVLAAVFNVGINLIFIPRFSYWASAIASVTAEFLVMILGLYLVIRHINYWPKIDKFYSIVASGSVMSAFLYFSPHWNFFLRGAISVFIYALFLWFFGAVKSQEITSIISKKSVKEYSPC